MIDKRYTLKRMKLLAADPQQLLFAFRAILATDGRLLANIERLLAVHIIVEQANERQSALLFVDFEDDFDSLI